LIAGSPGPVFEKQLGRVGLDVPRGSVLAGPLDRWYQEVGETPLTAPAARRGRGPQQGWSLDQVRQAGEAAAEELEVTIQPFAVPLIADHRRAGDLLVLATSAPEPLVQPLATRLGFDSVVATRWRAAGASYTGELDGPVVRGRDKVEALRAWADARGVRLEDSTAYAAGFADAPLLAAVGQPVAVNPDPQLAAAAALRRWPVRHLDVPDGVVKVWGREMQEWARPLMRPELITYARFEFSGEEHLPRRGPAIVVFNHRSYFDPTVLGLLASRADRSVRGLGKKELFDVPIVGRLTRMMGAIRVDRGSGSDEPLDEAARALQAGELVMIAPQGTIPRGRAFFEPELRGRWGAARLAQRTGAPVIPVGIWGTDKVWPRSSRLPNLAPLQRPLVTVTVGPPVPLERTDVDADTRAIMSAIVDLLPEEARLRREPTEGELRRTFPPGYRGDPEAELDRRPGTDT
jgi:putative phosphoserine phosphatase/1-acylglycerol-3-phosphate O-acyltransferase